MPFGGFEASGASGSPDNPTVGDPVVGGGANRVLYEDGSQNLAASAGMTYSGTELTLTGFLNANGSIGSYNSVTSGNADHYVQSNTSEIDVQSFGSTAAGTVAGINKTSLNQVASIGGKLIVGTTDSQTLTLMTNNTVAVTVGATQIATFAASPSVPGAGANSERFGLSATAAGDRTVAMGKLASAPATDDTVVGYSAVGKAASGGNGGITYGAFAGTLAGAGSDATQLGAYAQASGNYSTAIGGYVSSDSAGSGAKATAAASGAIGPGAQATAAGAWAMGMGSFSSTANQLVWGSNQTSGSITRVVIGNGQTAAAPVGHTYTGTAGSGSNVAGVNLTVDAPNGTGTGGSGSLIFRAAPVAASSSTPNAYATAMTIPSTGIVSIPAATTTTQSANDNSTKVATTAYVDTAYPWKTAAYSAVATGTTVVPVDDTIPQNTEGDEYMTLTYTPTSAANYLRIRVFGMFANDTVLASAMAMALFRDSTASAVAVEAQSFVGAGFFIPLQLEYTVVAGSVSATTFKIRAGCNNAGTTTFNGGGGARYYGAIQKSSITIEEIKPPQS